jgi:AAA family ATP:ADP antiporter
MTQAERIKGWLPVRDGEWPLVLATGLFAFLAVAFAIALRTWSDAVFLTTFDAGWIPWLFVASALVFVPATLGYAWLAPRIGAIWLNTFLLILFIVAMFVSMRLAQGAFGVFVTVLAMQVISPLANVIAWNAILDRIDNRQARRLLPVIGGISTLGAISAGVVGGEMAARIGNEALLWIGVCLLCAMVPLPLALAVSRERRIQRYGPDIRSALRSLTANRLIGTVAIATFLMALTTNVIDYQFKAFAQDALAPESLGVFFGRFHGATNLAVLLVQFFVAPVVMRRFGVGLSFALHPIIVMLGAALTLFMPALAAIVMLRFADTMLKFTFHKNSNDLALTPVPAHDRHQAMVFIKGIVYPLGGIAAGLLLWISSLLGFDAMSAGGYLVLGLGSCWFVMVRRVRSQYVQQIGEKLSIEVHPVRRPAPDPGPASLMRELQRSVREIRELQSRMRLHAEPEIGTAIIDALDHLFVTLGELIGDPRAVAEAAQRYLHGSGSERAYAVELLDTLLDTHRVPAATDLLDSLSRDRARGLLQTEPRLS